MDFSNITINATLAQTVNTNQQYISILLEQLDYAFFPVYGCCLIITLLIWSHMRHEHETFDFAVINKLRPDIPQFSGKVIYIFRYILIVVFLLTLVFFLGRVHELSHMVAHYAGSCTLY